MSSKRHLRRKACEGKVRHESSAAAMRHIRSLRRQGDLYTGPLNAYRCEFCRGYHIGHRINQRSGGLKGRRP